MKKKRRKETVRFGILKISSRVELFFFLSLSVISAHAQAYAHALMHEHAHEHSICWSQIQYLWSESASSRMRFDNCLSKFCASESTVRGAVITAHSIWQSQVQYSGMKALKFWTSINHTVSAVPMKCQSSARVVPVKCQLSAPTMLLQCQRSISEMPVQCLSSAS